MERLAYGFDEVVGLFYQSDHAGDRLWISCSQPAIGHNRLRRQQAAEGE